MKASLNSTRFILKATVFGIQILISFFSMLQENGSYDYLHCINTNDQHKSCRTGERQLVRDAGLFC